MKWTKYDVNDLFALCRSVRIMEMGRDAVDIAVRHHYPAQAMLHRGAFKGRSIMKNEEHNTKLVTKFFFKKNQKKKIFIFMFFAFFAVVYVTHYHY